MELWVAPILDVGFGQPSETWLKSFLIRQGFSGAAIEPAMTSYLQQENAYESHGAPPPPPVDSASIEELDGDDEMEVTSEKEPAASTSGRRDTIVKKREVANDLAERTVFTEEGAPGQYLTLKVSGEVTDDMLEALEDYVKRQRKRLQRVE